MSSSPDSHVGVLQIDRRVTFIIQHLIDEK